MVEGNFDTFLSEMAPEVFLKIEAEEGRIRENILLQVLQAC
jgi:hypothetical protein